MGFSSQRHLLVKSHNFSEGASQKGSCQSHHLIGDSILFIRCLLSDPVCGNQVQAKGKVYDFRIWSVRRDHVSPNQFSHLPGQPRPIQDHEQSHKLRKALDEDVRGEFSPLEISRSSVH